jgi:hypothetical protein
MINLEPFVVEASQITDVNVYTQMGRLFVLDRRIEPALFAATTSEIQEVYEPVYADLPISGADIPDFTNKEMGAPHAYWICVEKVPASERIRYPMLPAKVNYKEGVDMGELRELYCWDGLGFKLRDPKWGKD